MSRRSGRWRPALSMIPLWTTAMSSDGERWGWAFARLGGPWVAQRVCAIPQLPAGKTAVQGVFQLEYLARTLLDRQTMFVRDDRDSGRIVAAVLEAFQPLQEDRAGWTRPDIADDSTHQPVAVPSSILRARSTSARAAEPPGASAIRRTTGSVPEGRTCSQLLSAGHSIRSPSVSSIVPGGAALPSAAYASARASRGKATLSFTIV